VRLRHCFFVTLAALFLLLSATISEATTVERLTLEDLTLRAGAIVQGTVQGSQAHWDSAQRVILTTTTIQVSEAIKGRPPSVIQITTVGGRIGNSVLHVAGMPKFRPGETAILFAEQSGSFVTVLGLNQGKFSVTGGDAENSVSELSFPDGKPSRPYKMPVASLRSRIRSILESR
jgi:hypothetical protein